MGRHARRRLAELALDRAVEALEDSTPDARLARERLREERRLRREAESRRSMMGVGVGLLVGGLASLSLPTVAAVGLGFVAAMTVVWLLRVGGDAAAAFLRRLASPAPRRVAPAAPPRVLEAGLSESRRALTQSVLDEAAGEVARLRAAEARAPDADAAELIGRVAEAAARLCDRVAAAPGLLSVAQRALTYHLAKAALLAEDLTAAGGGRDPGRAGAVRLTLARIDNLFEKTELDLLGAAGGDMDLELRLINQALDEDLGGERTPRSREAG